MPTFQYLAYGTRGEFAQGRVDAVSQDAASEMLWAQGLTPFQMQPVKNDTKRWWERELFSRTRESARDLASFTREFSILMTADLPLDDTLRILCDQAGSRQMAQIANDLRADVLNGLALSDALQNHSALFSKDYIAIVRAGEIGGNLPSVLAELADFLERRVEIQTRIRSALVYPLLLLVLAAGALSVVIGVLVPSVASIFQGSGHPMPTMLGFALALQMHWVEILIAIACSCGALAWMTYVALSKPNFRRAIDRTLLKLPAIGSFILDQETGRFSRTLGALLRAGVPLLHASLSARGVVRNSHLGQGLDRAIDSIREGSALHQALTHEARLPALAMQMICVGEEAGKLDSMLTRVATMFEQKTQHTAERFMTALTPLLTIVMAVVVGSLVMSVIDAVMSVNELAFQ